MEEVHGAEKSPKRIPQRENKRLQWKPVTAENRKVSTKDWVNRTFYSQNNTVHTNNNPNSSISEQQQTTSSNDPIAKPIHSLPNHTKCSTSSNNPIAKSIPSLATDSRRSTNQPILNTHKSNSRNGCQKRMHDQKNTASHIPKNVSPLPNDPKPSVNRPRFSYAEALVNQSNAYQKTTEGDPAQNSPNVSVYRGEPAIYFKESVITSNAEKFRYCLVGKFPRSWPGLAHIREWVARCWKLKGSCSITLLDHHHVLIRLDNEFDMIRIWVKNRWWVKGHLMKVFKWTPQFRPAREEPSSAAVWIALPFLNVVFFQEDVLFSIASLVGRALAVDDPTRILSRTNVARVCVEVSLLMQLPHRVWIGIEGEGFWQDIHYENLPSYCSNCCQQGHSTRICKFNPSNIVTDDSQGKTVKSRPENSNSTTKEDRHAPQGRTLKSSPENSNSTAKEDRHALKGKTIKSSSKNSNSTPKEDGHTQKQHVVSETFVHNCVDSESSQAKHVHSCPAIQDERNQLVVEASTHLPPRRVTIVEAMTKSLENSEKIRSSMNNGNLGFGGILTHSSIMNAMFLQRMEEEDLLEKEEEQLLEIETENIVLGEECPQAGNIALEEVTVENEFRSYHQHQQHQRPLQVQDFSQVIAVNEENRNSQGQRVPQAPPTRRKFLANKPIFFWRKKPKNTPRMDAFLENYEYLGPKRYKYSDIKKMTSSFRDKIGEGGFGGVFKGMLPDGSLVAVKVLRDCRNGENEFITEVATSGKTSHVNIIRLFGFCSEGTTRALVYEFVANGSLDKFIYVREIRSNIGWRKLCEVAVGIARGLEYLHHGCSISIFHLDVKPSNILLDEELCPRISDFGLAKLCPRRDPDSNAVTCARGTMGYIAPELFFSGNVSNKTDVYSYGVTLLEMASGRKVVSVGSVSCSLHYLPDWIYKRFILGEDIEVGVFESVEEEEIAKKMMLVGLWCTQQEPRHRPSMSTVLEMLEGSIEGLQMPPNPSFHNFMLEGRIEALQMSPNPSFTDSLIWTSPISEAVGIVSNTNSLQGR
ncbi:uncharacterized protein LOC143853056 [Tasmannia lanceolata]|uniref:uncharacterized protein LOC143853056 n=1 Tax=Tasmannia lanceolata TaxID=3420 RepID=UPI0040646452